MHRRAGARFAGLLCALSRVRSGFEQWSNGGLWARIWQAPRVVLGEDHEALYLDSTSVKAHRHIDEACDKDAEAIGSSDGEGGSKIHAVFDGLVYFLAFGLGTAQHSDIAQVD